MPDTTPMSMRTAVNLAHALCQTIADARDLRVLFLKGPTAGEQGLRPTSHSSGDVDVLCIPDDLPSMEAGLRARGWRQRSVSTAAKEFTTHSVTYIHDNWPCDVDVHTSFPGFFASPPVVFEALWQHREQHRFADVEVNTPDRVAQFLVLLLHGLRAPSLARNKREIESAQAFYRSELSTADRLALRDLVMTTAASEPTADFFAGVGDPIAVPPTPSESYIMWQLLTSPSRTESWMLRVSHTHGMAKARTLYRAVVPSRADMLADHPDSGAGFAALLAAHLRRLRRAMRLAPHAIRAVVAARRQLRRLSQPGSLRKSSAGDESLCPHASAMTATDAGRPSSSPVASETHSAPASQPAHHALARNAIEWDETESTLFVLPLTTLTQSPVALRDTAADLWLLMEEHGSGAAALATAASAHWDVPEDSIRPAIEDFLQELTRVGALVPG